MPTVTSANEIYITSGGSAYNVLSGGRMVIKSGSSLYEISGSGGTDVSDTTAVAGTVLGGYEFYDSNGVKTSGSIQTVSASLSANVATVPAGYIATSQTLTVPEASSATVTNNVVTIPVGYVATSRTIEVGSAKESATITPTTSNQIISSGQYLTGNQTILGDENLTSANIASGVSIFGVVGTHQGGIDTSDANATANDLLEGKSAFVSGSKISGAIPILASSSYTPTTSNQTISSGQYLGGVQTILGDANLISSNILSGVSIFGISGTLEISSGADVTLGVVDSQGKFQPLSFSGTSGTSSGTAETVSSYRSWNSYLPVPEVEGRTDFYKCASVDSTNHTWTGYKAILNNGVYRYESSVTSNLTYGSGFTPEVGKVYSDEARIQSELFSIPTNGLVFYAPLSSAAQTAETGQNLITMGNVTYQNVNGIPCAYSDTTSGIKTDVQCAYMDPGIPKTMSVWVKITQLSQNEYNQGAFCSLQGTGGVTFVYYTVDADTVDLNFDRWDSNVSNNYNRLQFGNVSLNTWYHFVAVDTGTELRAYINGQLIQSNSASTNYQKCQYSSELWSLSALEESSLIGYMASARIYNRALSADEVLALSKEFTPAAS